MGSIVWLGFLAFFVVSLVVGVRLVRLAHRTRRLPELLIGVGVLGIGPVGFGLSVAAQQLGARPGLAAGLLAVGTFAVAAGVVAKLVFNWRVYHPESRGVRILVGLGALVMAVTWIEGAGAGPAALEAQDLGFFLRYTVQIGALLWGSGEALRYFSLMRRRERLGLADPVVANRFLLWGIGAGAAGVGSLIGVTYQVVTGQAGIGVGWVLASSSAHGMVAAVAMWLAFLPPEAYRRRVRERGVRRAAGAAG